MCMCACVCVWVCVCVCVCESNAPSGSKQTQPSTFSLQLFYVFHVSCVVSLSLYLPSTVSLQHTHIPQGHIHTEIQKQITSLPSSSSRPSESAPWALSRTQHAVPGSTTTLHSSLLGPFKGSGVPNLRQVSLTCVRCP